MLFKGFGEKTQQNVREAIEFRLKHAGSHLYADIEPYALQLDAALKKAFPTEKLALTGEFRRQLEIITKLQWVTTAEPEKLNTFLASLNVEEGIIIDLIYTTSDRKSTRLNSSHRR